MSSRYRALGLTLFFVSLCIGSPARAENETAFQAIDAFIADEDIDYEDPQWRQTLNRPPRLVFDPDKTYTWLLETTKGEMKFELFPDIAPMHVSSTIYLTRLGFYEGLFFHRVIRSFMAQSGDPLGNGVGHPGYHMDGEFTKQRKGKHRKPGTLSAANRGPGTDGSQFFITFKAVKELDGKHTVYGLLAEGKKVLRAVERVGSAKGTPKERIEIVSASVSVE